MPTPANPSSETVTLTINGRQVTVRAGTNLIDAAAAVGIHIPHYCYHPGLSVPANCRICQVEVEGQPKLVFGCRTLAQDGMVVHTDSPRAKEHQQLVQEFLLCNHPLDCPICDKSGECRLQDYYMEYGRYQPVMLENKYKKHKAVPIGPTIVLDAERCILCSRCVRFCDEVTKTSELGLFHRNNHTEIGIVPGTVLDNPYSGNLVDICPVGALGDRDFRFKCRVWYLRHTPSICPGCARGCNIVVDHQTQRHHIAGGARIMRLRPRFHGDVNGHWMCDDGRYDYRWHDEDRLLSAAVRGEGLQREASLAEAVAAVRDRLRAENPGAWTAVLSSELTNEDLFVAKRLCEALRIEDVFVAAPPQGVEDDILRLADKTPNTAGARALGLAVDEDGARLRGLLASSGRHVWVFQHDILAGHPGDTQPAFATLIYQGTNLCATSLAADIVLPTATCFEKDGTFANAAGRVQRLWQAVPPLGDAASDAALLQRIGQALGVALPEGHPEELFEVLAASEAAFAGMSYETLGSHGLPLATPVEAGR